MEKCCGSCRNFTRMPKQQFDLCETWSNPTTSDRVGCEFWLLHPKKDKSKKQPRVSSASLLPVNR